ncbi:MAG: pyridoxal-phosphate dependent enzyme [Acidobacteria bacterium]|nr:pyridoxal-phosphate dependent enzyme [Acidobacteriota bacterium]
MLEKYRQFLPIPKGVETNDLGEGNTPMVRSGTLNPGGNLLFKMEQMNPTGSFKDRFASLETLLIKSSGRQAFIATSSGNTGAALAAYAARRGLDCFLFVNEVVPESKLNQMPVYGAKVFRVKDFGISHELSAPIFQRLQEFSVEENIPLVISAYKYCPDGMEGVKPIAYEIVEQLGKVPDRVFVPVGGGGLLSGIWRGFCDLKENGIVDSLPKMMAVQPELNDTLVTPLSQSLDKAREVSTTTTISGLAVQVDIDATMALQSVKASGGAGVLVTDEQIRDAKTRLSMEEGIYVEAAGASSVTGYLKALADGAVSEDETSVCILTGHGLKDAATGSDIASRIHDITADDITKELVA